MTLENIKESTEKTTQKALLSNPVAVAVVFTFILIFGFLATVWSSTCWPILLSLFLVFSWWHVSYTLEIMFEPVVLKLCGSQKTQCLARIITWTLVLAFLGAMINQITMCFFVTNLNSKASFFMHTLTEASLLFEVSAVLGLILSPFQSCLKIFPEVRWSLIRATLCWITTFILILFSFIHFNPINYKQIEIPLPHLSECMDNFKIAVLTDVHAGTLSRKTVLEQVVRETNEMEPDAVFVLGDISDGKVDDLAEILQPLEDIEAPFGKFFVTGNHEALFTKPRNWEIFMEERGYEVLSNRYVTIQRGHYPFCTLDIIGVSDSTIGADLEQATADRLAFRPSILLSHQPSEFQNAVQKDIGLTLSGHAPIFPLYVNTNAVGNSHVSGLFKDGESLLYVSSGTVGWGAETQFLTKKTLIVLRSPSFYGSEGKHLDLSSNLSQRAAVAGVCILCIVACIHLRNFICGLILYCKR